MQEILTWVRKSSNIFIFPRGTAPLKYREITTQKTSVENELLYDWGGFG
jgi:hypothetical protein